MMPYPPDNGVRLTADTLLVIDSNGAGRRVMPGVGRLRGFRILAGGNL
jgi:hypothetical protein